MDSKSEGSVMVMEDYTSEVLSGDLMIMDNMADNPADAPEIQVTIEMLRKRPALRKVLHDSLADMILPWPGHEEEPDDYQDQQLLVLLKLDPFVNATVMECLLQLADCSDAEGEQMYRPSIFDTDVREVLLKHMENGGFREDHEPVPAIYDHLDKKHIDMIYATPEARQILSKLPKSVITPEFVESMCS